MIYDTTITMGRYWHLKDWWKLIIETFHEYVNSNVKFVDGKKTELAQRYTSCQDESDYANIWMEENEIYNYWLLRSALNAGLMYIYSQFERKMVELAKIVCLEYISPRGGIIASAYNAIRSTSELELSISWNASWQAILDFQQIRHACVHYDGFAYEQRQIDAINSLVPLLKAIERCDGSWEICLTKDNLIWVADKMTYCFELLIDELEKCENREEK